MLLSGGQRQRIAVARAIATDPDFIIMDEPTSVLTPQEVDILFKTLNKLKEEGTSILYISHKLDEVLSIAQRVTVLRAGRSVCTRSTAGMDAAVQRLLTAKAELNLKDSNGRTPLLAAAKAAGLLMQGEEHCVKCHNEKSPTYKEFKYEEAAKTGIHEKQELKYRKGG